MGIIILQKSGKDPCAICPSGVSIKSSFSVACSSWVLNGCSIISDTLKPDPIFRGKRCTGLTKPVDNRWQRSQREGRRLRCCHPSATLWTDHPRVAAVNSMPSQDAVSHGANSMSPCPSAHPHLLLISHHLQRRTLHLRGSGTWGPTSSNQHNLQRNDRAIISCVCGVTTKEQVSSQDILYRMQFDDLKKEPLTCRPRWHSNVERSDS